VSEHGPSLLQHPSLHELFDRLPPPGDRQMDQKLMIGEPHPLLLTSEETKWVSSPQVPVDLSVDPPRRRRRSRGVPKLRDLLPDPASVFFECFTDLPHGRTEGRRHNDGPTELDGDPDGSAGRAAKLELEGAILQTELSETFGDGGSHGRELLRVGILAGVPPGTTWPATDLPTKISTRGSRLKAGLER
jgi:hypothetical protein